MRILTRLGEVSSYAKMMKFEGVGDEHLPLGLLGELENEYSCSYVDFDPRTENCTKE